MLITVIGILVTTKELTMVSTFSKRTPGDLFHAVKDDPALLAVGVGGGSTAQDVDCAQAGLRMLDARALGAE
jgi:uncharacterized protein GlcG (DUF336 family)